MEDGNPSVITADEFLKIGLKLVGFKRRRIRRCKKKTNVDRFVDHFGSVPCICASTWEDFQTTEVMEAQVPVEDLNVECFLMALHHLKRHLTEGEREAIFDISKKWGRDKVWFCAEKVQALKKAQKIVWPDVNFGDDIWALTVDGTHCWIREPQHPTWSQDPERCSHKFDEAGVNHELWMSMSEDRLVWMNGPFKAGMNDVTIFKQKGLKTKVWDSGKKAIGDGGCSGHTLQISTPNSHDSKQVFKFKSRALKRQEKFNELTKNFDCLSRCCYSLFKRVD
jgi:hypothetical protein